ncbi:MAG: 4-(cytidine 5'-diphospho)-2-C-methyl-D-erythritol kinase [Bacteroidota bacterium]|jgi:4-diphosphocytidyl-2-C-methyl-D-erythritol kinase
MGLKAYAKINLGLRILRKRDDGYHDIETVFHRIDLFDEVTFHPSQDVSFSSSDAGLPTDDRNLCVRAAESLRRRCNVDDGVRIHLKKNIPVGAGLGGGSSDAAATLLGLVQFWKLKISDAELLSIALQLGSDVPYFLKSGTACATGRGDVLEYFSLDVPSWIVLVYPNVQVSTAWAYAEHDRPNEKGGRGDRVAGPISLKQIVCDNIARPRMFSTLLRNDLEPVVFRAHESLAGLKQALFDAGADFAQMSGSGSSVYGFFSDEHLVTTAAEKLAIHYRVFVTRPHFRATS